MNTPSSSSPKPDHQKPKSIFVAVEEKKTMNTRKQGSPQEIVSERTITETPSFGLGVVRREREIMKKYPPKDNLVYNSNYCKLRFPTFNALRGHQNTHKLDRVLERQQQKKNESSSCPQWPKPYNHYQYNLNSGHSQDASSNDKYLGTSLDPSKPNGNDSNSSSAYPSFNGGVTRGNTDMTMTVEHHVTPYRSLTRNTSYGASSKDPLPSYNYNMNNNHVGLSSGPLKSRGSGTTSSAYPWFNGGVMKTVVARGIRYPYFMDNISNKSASRDTLPSYNYSPHALSNDGHDVELSLGRFESIGGGGNNNYIPNIVSNDDHIELSLGPSKCIGENNSVYPSLNDGVTRETTSMNMPLRPRVSRYHYVNGNPLDSITRNVPPSPPPTTNISNDLSSLKQNVSGSSYSENLISKGKNIIIVDDDDKDILVIEDGDNDKDILVIEDDDDKDILVVEDDDDKDVLVIEDDDDKDILVIEDHDAKSWGRGLSLSL